MIEKEEEEERKKEDTDQTSSKEDFDPDMCCIGSACNVALSVCAKF